MKGTGGKRREKGRAGERGGKEGEWNEEMVGILSTPLAVLPPNHYHFDPIPPSSV